MHELILLRHAEAVPIENAGDDQQRPLSARGEQEAQAAGLNGWPAMAAGPIACCVRPPGAPTKPRDWRWPRWQRHRSPQMANEIYDASPGELLALLDQHGDADTVMLVGHNPASSGWWRCWSKVAPTSSAACHPARWRCCI
jgi:phosphohistidine phosphatase